MRALMCGGDLVCPKLCEVCNRLNDDAPPWCSLVGLAEGVPLLSSWE